jgi:Sulfotransferase family
MKCQLDFIVIGAQKAGTTSLFEYLRNHPEISLPTHKEAPYFSHDTKWKRDWSKYISDEFRSADSSGKWGTVTPSYMVGGVYEATNESKDDPYDEWTVPRRIASRLPDVRLIAILRDPVERAKSHYKMMLLNGQETRTFDSAIDNLLTPKALNDSRKHPEEVTGYVTWGEYGRILAAYFEVFSPDQMLVLFTDDLQATPERVLYRVHEFLNIAPDYLPTNLGTKYREGSTARRFSWLNTATIQSSLAHMPLTRTLWHSLPSASRQWMDRRYEDMSYWVDLKNRRSADLQFNASPSTLVRLREHFVHDTNELTKLIDTAPPWAKLSGES